MLDCGAQKAKREVMRSGNAGRGMPNARTLGKSSPNPNLSLIGRPCEMSALATRRRLAFDSILRLLLFASSFSSGQRSETAVGRIQPPINP